MPRRPTTASWTGSRPRGTTGTRPSCWRQRSSSRRRRHDVLAAVPADLGVFPAGVLADRRVGTAAHRKETEMSERLISDEDACTLNAARTVLEQLKSTALSQAWTATNDDSARPSGLGYLAGQADAAGHQLFEVLNAAHAYCHEPLSDE